MTATIKKTKVRANVRRLLAGAVVGGTTTALFLAFVGERYIDMADPVAMVAVATGLIYALMGLSVGFGLISPATGARFLNVEDADELREERPNLQLGAAACVFIGLFFLVLAFAASGALISAPIVLTVAAVSLIATVALAIVSSKRADEMTRQIGLEASSFTLNVALVVLAAWAALWQFNYVGALNPLALVSALSLLHMVAIMAVAATKGMLTR